MPKIPQVIRGPAQLGGPARPEDFGSGRGSEAVAQAGKEVAEVNYRLFNEEMESRVSGAVGRAARELNTLQHEVTQIPDHNERTAIYAKKSQKIISGIRESLTFPKFQGRFGERIEPTLERGRMSIAQGVRQSQIDNSRGERLINIERLQDDFANAANEGYRERIRKELNVEFAESLQGGLWSPEAIARMKIAAENRMEGDTLLVQSQVEADSIADLHAGNPEAMIEAARKLPEGRLREMTLALVNNHITTDQKIRTEKLRSSNHKTLSGIESGEYDGAGGVERLLAEGEREGRDFGHTRKFLDLLDERKKETVVAPTQQSAAVRFALEGMHRTNQELFFGDSQMIGAGGGPGIAVNLHSGNWSVDPTTGDLQPDPKGTTLGNLMNSTDRDFVQKLMDAGPGSAVSADQKEADLSITNLLIELGFGEGDDKIPMNDPRAHAIRTAATRAIDSKRSEKGHLLPAELDNAIQAVKDFYSRRIHHREPGVMDKYMPLMQILPSLKSDTTAPLAILGIDDIDYDAIPREERNRITERLSKPGKPFPAFPEDEPTQRLVIAEYLKMLRAGRAGIAE